MNWVIERLKEGSTWRGITVLLAAVGITISPELQEQIIAAGLGIAGVIGIIWAEKQNKKDVE